MKRLIYLPCESYKERWTEIVSGPDGVFERGLKRMKIPYVVLRPWTETRTIKTGLVMDTVGRTEWGFSQVEELVRMVFDGRLTQEDVIYIEDFWQPGMEMIPYAFSMKWGAVGSPWPKVSAFCHAQSVDPNDFTRPMRWWMRGFEKAWSGVLTKVFVADSTLKSLYDRGIGGVAVHVCGTIFDSTLVQMIAGARPAGVVPEGVVFTSRWDKEKDPEFFLILARRCPDIRFTICTGQEHLKSNDPCLVAAARMVQAECENLEILTGLSKTEYYQVLLRSKVQFNCAHQDFVSYTLLEATALGCHPLYPRYLSFPFALDHSSDNLYHKGNLEDAEYKLRHLLLSDPRDYSFVYGKYNHSQKRLLQELGFEV